MLLLLLLLCEQPPFFEIWATGAGELGQLLFLSCPSERRGQPRTAAAHGLYRALGKDPRGPALPLASAAPACGLAPLGAGVSHPRSLCCRGLPALASTPHAAAGGSLPWPALPHSGCRSSGVSMPRAAGKEVPPQHCTRERCASKLAKTTLPSLPAALSPAGPELTRWCPARVKASNAVSSRRHLPGTFQKLPA